LHVGAVTAKIDVEASGLLNGLEGRAREERRELVEWLLGRGFDVDQIRSELSPMLLAANRVIGDDGTLRSAREVADCSGVSLDLLQRLHRAAGLAGGEDPDVPVQSRADAESVVRAAQLVDLGFDPDQVAVVVRMLSEGLRSSAMTIRYAALQSLLHPGATELELAQAFEELAREAEHLIDPVISDLFRLALRHSLQTEAINAAERAAGMLPGARQVAVAFADLVGFTRLGEETSAEDLEMVAGQLADLAHDVVTDPVQLVKTIGDAVMLVSPDPKKLLTTVLELLEAASAEHLPRLRVGMAFGPAVSRAGDWYGSPVNLASRATQAAPPGAVLVDEPARTAIGDVAGIDFTALAPRYFKGVRGEVPLFRARLTHGLSPEVTSD
jgi:adenylate cyclase